MGHMPSSTWATATSSIVASLTNNETTTVTLCTPVYSNAAGGFKKALGDASLKASAIGIIADQTIDAAQVGSVLTSGTLIANASQWDAVCGTTGGLAFGTKYYLSTTLAGKLTTSVASGVAVIEGLSPTTALLIAPGTSGGGGGGTVGPGTVGTISRFTTTTTIGDSGVTDDGTQVALATRKFQLGPTAPSVGQKAMITAAQSSTTTQVWIEETDTGHQGDTTGLLGGCEAINLVLRQTAVFDTSASATPANASCIDLSVAATRTVGSQPLTNTGILIQSVNGDTNYAINILSGILKSVASVDFSGAVSLGNNVSNFEIPGSTSTVARIGIGALPAVDGTQIQTKNTVTGSATAGVEVGLDTTVAANIRGGFWIFRGAGGGFGGNSAGTVIASGAGFPFTTSAANELALYSEFGTPLTFGADSSGFTKGMTLETNNDLRVAGKVQIGSLSAGLGIRVSSGSGTPNGVVTGWPGDIYSNTAGGTGLTVYFKESGSNTNTGWVTGALAPNRVPVTAITSNVAIANTETVVVAMTIPANTLTVGAVLQFYAIANNAGAGSNPTSFKLRFGPTTLTGTAIITETRTDSSQVIKEWSGGVTVRSIGASGTALGESLYRTPDGGGYDLTFRQNGSAPVTIDTTVANRMEVTFISGNAASTYTFYQAYINQVF